MPSLISIYRTPYYEPSTKQYVHVLTVRPPLSSPPGLLAKLRLTPLPPVSEYAHSDLRRTTCHQVAWDTAKNRPLHADDAATALIDDLATHASFTIDSTITQLLQNNPLDDGSTLLAAGRVA